MASVLDTMDSRCAQCGDTNDLWAAFSSLKVCMRCVRKNHRDAVAGRGRRRVAAKGGR
jgi:hypothetical protein